MDIGEHLYDLKDQEVMLIIAPIGPVEEPSLICGLCRTPYEGDECPTCRTEREDAKRVIEERLREDRADKDRLIGDVEEWLDTSSHKATRDSWAPGTAMWPSAQHCAACSTAPIVSEGD